MIAFFVSRKSFYILNLVFNYSLYSVNKIQSKFFIRESSDSCDAYIHDSKVENSIFITEIDSINFIVKANLNPTFINKCKEIKTIRNEKLKTQFRF